MDFQFLMYGVNLVPFVLGIVMLAQSLGLSEYWAEYLRAGLLGLLALLVMNQEFLAVQFPWFETGVKQALTVAGVVLMAKGVWPDARSMWNRAVVSKQAGELMTQVTHNMRRF
jgi:hypothetical protein